MPLNDASQTSRAIAAAVDRAAAPAQALTAAVDRMLTPLRTVQAACKLNLPQLTNPLEMK